ncbi:MAG TPA: tRNA uridine-5-carboxymethylaminomethyl(34) synthesis GTPase MnmE [Oscillospiraceae bacterium]|nr:tRNA uridine-5-carboxymethylaminomethyl(34) synthesis GTPase MnmE [Oscillospiraceae bacterium]
MKRDTIAAVATAAGRGAIGILRLSGPEAIRIADAVFRADAGGTLSAGEERKLRYGTLADGDGRALDRVLATVSRAPGSYTGEDTAELHCHGAPAVLAAGLAALFRAGARQALPGEFTRRAFLNGKLDLTQAEAVADLIDAESAGAARLAASQLSGSVRRRAEEIYDGLVGLMAHVQAAIDFTEDDVAPVGAEELSRGMEDAAAALGGLLDTAARGRLVRSGVATAIVGRPNVGKSSLLNALVGYERAIVSKAPGTTRDTLAERVSLGTVTLRLIDTAGLRAARSEAERQGVSRARAALEEALLVLVVVDGSRPLSKADEAVFASLPKRKTICILNKSDLPQKAEETMLHGRFGCVLRLSALSGAGIDALTDAIRALFCGMEPEAGEAVLTNERQTDAASRALSALTSARAALASGMTPDALLLDLEEAAASLGEITGRTVREDVVEHIFTRFCVGK